MRPHTCTANLFRQHETSSTGAGTSGSGVPLRSPPFFPCAIRAHPPSLFLRASFRPLSIVQQYYCTRATIHRDASTSLLNHSQPETLARAACGCRSLSALACAPFCIIFACTRACKLNAALATLQLAMMHTHALLTRSSGQRPQLGGASFGWLRLVEKSVKCFATVLLHFIDLINPFLYSCVSCVHKDATTATRQRKEREGADRERNSAAAPCRGWACKRKEKKNYFFKESSARSN